jgi:hypothetical protein
VLEKKFILLIKSWFFHNFSLFFSHGFAWYHLQCDHYDQKLKFLVFFKKNYKVRSVEVLSQDRVNKKNFNSLIITIMELKFEACVLNLIWKWGAKEPKKWEDHLIFINFGEKKFIVKVAKKKKNFDVWMLYSPRSHRMKSSNFLRWIYNKVTLRS